MRRQTRAACARRSTSRSAARRPHLGNACEAGCANVAVAHNGACGIPGDCCGTMFGLACRDDNKCRFGASTYTYPFPDAGGTCVANELLRRARRLQRSRAPRRPRRVGVQHERVCWQAGPVEDPHGRSLRDDEPVREQHERVEGALPAGRGAALRLQRDASRPRTTTTSSRCGRGRTARGSRRRRTRARRARRSPRVPGPVSLPALRLRLVGDGPGCEPRRRVALSC